MGLDMYLNRKHYVKQWDHQGPSERFIVTVEKGGEPFPAVDPAKVSYVIEQVAYWRKANQIHHWFVENVQDGRDECQPSYVDSEKLAELLGIVRRVLADRSLAKELLPPQPGFFFGTYEFDDWYFSNLEETEKMLAEIVEWDSQHDTYPEYEYQASW